jgi:hypothetical protein
MTEFRRGLSEAGHGEGRNGRKPLEDANAGRGRYDPRHAPQRHGHPTYCAGAWRRGRYGLESHSVRKALRADRLRYFMAPCTARPGRASSPAGLSSSMAGRVS